MYGTHTHIDLHTLLNYLLAPHPVDDGDAALRGLSLIMFSKNFRYFQLITFVRSFIGSVSFVIFALRLIYCFFFSFPFCCNVLPFAHSLTLFFSLSLSLCVARKFTACASCVSFLFSLFFVPIPFSTWFHTTENDNE